MSTVQAVQLKPLNFDQFQKQRHDFDKRELTPAGWVLDAALYRISQLICPYQNCPCDFDSDICDCQCGDRCASGLVVERFEILEREMNKLRAGIEGARAFRAHLKAIEANPFGGARRASFLTWLRNLLRRV